MSKTKIKHPNSLAEYRHRMGFTQEQVTKLLGYKRRHAMWILETGQSVPSLTTVLKLAAIYRTPVEFLYHADYLRLREEIRKREESLPPRGQQSLFPILLV
jgi:DNA-binding XRE family transcriptional regulator